MAMNEAALRLVISAQNLTQEAFASLSSSLSDIATALGKINGDSDEADAGLERVSEQSGPMDALRAAVASVADSLTPISANAEKAVAPLQSMSDSAVPGLDATKTALGEIETELTAITTSAPKAGAALDKVSAGGVGGAEAASLGGAAGGLGGAEVAAGAAAGAGASWTKGAEKLAGLGPTFAMLGAGIGAIGGISVFTSAKFQQSMELLRTQAGASQREVDKLTQSVLAMGGTVPQGPGQLADALYHLESVGMRGARAMDALKVAAEGSAVGGANLADTTYALSSAVNTGIRGTQNFNEAMGALVAISGAGDMHMQDLGQAMSSGVLPAAVSAGLSLTDVGAALATLTDNGVPAQDAATRLRMTFSLLAAPTKQATKELASIGMSQLQLAQDMRSGGLLKALEDLKSHLSTLKANQQGEVIARAFGGGRSSASIITLLDSLDRLKSKYDIIQKGSKDFNTDWMATQRTAAVQWGEALSGVQSAAIRLGNALAPVAAKLAEAIKGVAEWFSHLSPGMIRVIADAVVALTAALIPLGLAMMALGVVARVVDNLSMLNLALDGALGPIALVAAAVVALGVVVFEVATHWQQITSWMQANIPGVWSGVGAVVRAVGDVIRTTVQGIASVVQAVWTSISSWTHQHWGEIETVIKAVVTVVSAVVTTWLSVVGGAIRGAWQGIAQTIRGVWGVIKGEVMLAVNLIEGIVGVFLDLITGHWSQAWTDLKTMVENVWHDIQTIVEGAINVIEGPINAFMGVISGVIGSVEKLLGLQDKAKSAASSTPPPAASTNGIVTQATNATNTSHAPAVHRPRIPHLAVGGMVDSPTLALIGESGPEAVLPMGEYPISASAIRPLPGGRGGGGDVYNIVINVTGNVTRSQNELADLIAERMQQRIKFRAQMAFA